MSNDSSLLDVTLHQLLKKCRENIRQFNTASSDDIVASLKSVVELLPQHSTGSRNFAPTELLKAQQIFAKLHYSAWLEFLIDCLSVDFISNLPKGQVPNLIDVFFLYGYPDKAFYILAKAVDESKGYKLNKVVSLLETFFRLHNVEQMLWGHCEVSGGQTSKSLEPYLLESWDQIIMLLASLPDRVCNKLQREASELFQTDNYIKKICAEVITVLHRCQASIRNDVSCSLEFISRLLAKLSITGYSDSLWKMLIAELECCVYQDYIWCRICERIIIGVPDWCLEVVIVPILRHVQRPSTIRKLFDNAILKNKKLEYLLTKKLLLLRCFEQTHIPRNIIGYLNSSDELRPLYKTAFQSLLTTWSDNSAVKHTTYRQHYYISAVLVICSAYINVETDQELATVLLQLLMSGMKHHLDSSVEDIRTVGMVVAEIVTAKLNVTGESLKFEYTCNSEIDQLKALSVLPEEPDIQDLESKLTQTQINGGSTDPVTSDTTSTLHDNDEELDSDDDLEPYDLSADNKHSKVKFPIFVRDCMEGLISSEDVDKLESCLVVAEPLIRAHSEHAQEIAVEFTKVLLQMNDEGAIVGFLELRFSAMKALCVISPKNVAEYLTTEFYVNNYNLRQRMDMLEVMSAASRELSEPKIPENKSSKSQHNKLTLLSEQHNDRQTNKAEHWRDVVQKRIDSKTRRFVKGRTKPLPDEVANRFAPVAGYFIFPLLQFFDRQQSTLNLLADDHIVLTKLIYSLGIMVYAAVNAPVLRQVAPCMLEFIWNLRYHSQQSVRQALLFAVSMVMLAVPGHILLPDLQTELLELRQWLEDVVNDDVDKECQKLAIQSMMLMEHTVKQEFGIAENS